MFLSTMFRLRPPGARRALALAVLFAALAAGAPALAQVKEAPRRWITTDHSQHEALKKAFASPEEVTRACLSCHNQAAKQVRQTLHWTWKSQGDHKLGKGGLVVNNF